MLFRRREPQDFWTRVRVALWPRVSWSRSAQYFRKRVLRLQGSPHAIALGVAIGVATAFQPFLGFHILIALGIAFLVGGNLVAAALGTAFLNPLTAPFIWAATYKIGHMIVGGARFRAGPPMGVAARSFHVIWPVIKPMIVGAIPLGIVAGAIFYVIVISATRGFRSMRRERLAALQRERKRRPGTSTMMEKA